MKRTDINREEIEDFLYMELVDEGFVPTDKEMQVLTNVVFDLVLMFFEPDILEDEGEDD